MKSLIRAALIAALLCASTSWTVAAAASSIRLAPSDSSNLALRLGRVGITAAKAEGGAALHSDTIACNGAADAPSTTTCAINFDGVMQARVYGDEAAALKQLLLRSLGANGPAIEPQHVLAADVVCVRSASHDVQANCTLSMIRPMAAGNNPQVANAKSFRD